MYKFGIIEGITIIGLFIEDIIGGGSTGVAMVVVSGVGVGVVAALELFSFAGLFFESPL